MRPPAALATLGVVLAAGLGLATQPADAFVASASIDFTTATLNLAGPANQVTISAANGLLVHDPVDAVFDGTNSRFDWDSTHDGDQTITADGAFNIVVNGSGGNDQISVLATKAEVGSVELNGGDGADVLTGADTDDTLNGGADDDILAGAKGDDVVDGGSGDDTLVWKDEDGSDRLDGDLGVDTLDVSGSPIRGDAFLLEPNGRRVTLMRLNLRTSVLDAAAERIHISGLGGGDSVDDDGDVSGLVSLAVDGGGGADRISGTDGPDVIRGGAGNDTINAGAGDDSVVWNDGDGSDIVNGGDGRDDVDVTGDALQGDSFTVQATTAAVQLDRINLVPFSLDISSSETLHLAGSGGADELAIGSVGAFSVVADGGAGNDSLTGGGSADTLLGGPGDDTIAAGGGHDFVSGDEGDDEVFLVDGAADLAFGGAGNDVVSADSGLDTVDGFETVHLVSPDTSPAVDAPPPAGPPPAVPPPPAREPSRPAVMGAVRVAHGRAVIRLTCPTTAHVNCTGSVVVRTATRVDAGGRHRILELGRARYSIAHGTSRNLTIKLAKVARSLVKAERRLKVVAVGSSARGAVVSSRRLTLTPAAFRA